jgi:hypothetical protein
MESCREIWESRLDRLDEHLKDLPRGANDG